MTTPLLTRGADVLEQARRALADPVDEPAADLCETWWWLLDHPAFRDEQGFTRFEECLRIRIVRLEEQTRALSAEGPGLTEIWLECEPWADPDGLISVSGPTFEHCLVRLAARWREEHGGYDDATASSPGDTPVRLHVTPAPGDRCDGRIC